MASKLWIGTDGNYAANGNWSPANVPTTGDHVRIPAGSAAITSGLNQSAVAIGDFIVEEGCAAAFASSAAYLQIDPDRFEFEGTGVSYIDIGSAAISPQVFNTAVASTGLRGLYLKGSAIGTLSVMKGKVGVATRHGETSTVTTIRCVGSSASVWVGAGVTLTTFYQTAGDSEVRCALTTLTGRGGTIRTTEIGAITTITAEGATIYPESVGTITTLNAAGGTVDFTGSGASRTVTTLKQNPGATIAFDPIVLTITNRSAPDYPIRLAASAG